MRSVLRPPRRRRDSILDTKLDPAQQADLYDRINKGMTYRAASEYLLAEHGITYSDYALWQWVRRRRSVTDDLTFAKLLETIRADKEQALALGSEIGSAQDLNEANVLLLSQALFETRRNNDLRGAAEVAKLFTSVLSAVTSARRAEISAFSAETGRRKSEFDAAEAALKHAGELQRINELTGPRHREKVALAVKRLFGQRPAQFNWPPPEPSAAPAAPVAALPQ